MSLKPKAEAELQVLKEKLRTGVRLTWNDPWREGQEAAIVEDLTWQYALARRDLEADINIFLGLRWFFFVSSSLFVVVVVSFEIQLFCNHNPFCSSILCIVVLLAPCIFLSLSIGCSLVSWDSRLRTVSEKTHAKF